jgi:hypothetical protein
VDPRAASEADVLTAPIVNFGGGIANTGPGLFDLVVANNSYSTLDTLTWVTGRHQLRFGTQIIRNEGNKGLGFQKLVNYLNLDDAAANRAFSLSTIGFPRVGLRNTYAHFFVQDDFRVNTHLTINMGLRYQYDTAPTESHGRIANFDLSTGTLDPVGSSVLDAPKLDFAPRFGIAYSPFNSGHTVFRAGYGIFFADLNAANLGQNMPSNTPGFQFNESVNALQIPGLAGLPFPDLSAFALPATAFSAIAKNFQMAYTQKWNFNVQQALSKNTLLQVEYLGSRSLHLQGGINENRLIAGTQTRPITGVGDVNFMMSGLISNYQALMTTFRQRFGHGLSFNLNYTWSHSIDDQPTIFSSFQDDHNVLNDYGSSDFDVRHNLEFDYTYALPAAPVIPGWLGAGWQINGITNIRSGFPYTVTCGCDPLGVGQATSRADLISPQSTKPANYSIPLAQLSLAAFASPVGHYGTLGRNTFSGPGAVNFDFSLFKDFHVRERQTVQFRAETFNIFNHPQFGNPFATLTAPSLFGASLGTIATAEGFHTSRQIQFALRYSF